MFVTVSKFEGYVYEIKNTHVLIVCVLGVLGGVGVELMKE